MLRSKAEEKGVEGVNTGRFSWSLGINAGSWPDVLSANGLWRVCLGAARPGGGRVVSLVVVVVVVVGCPLIKVWPGR